MKYFCQANMVLAIFVQSPRTISIKLFSVLTIGFGCKYDFTLCVKVQKGN